MEELRIFGKRNFHLDSCVDWFSVKDDSLLPVQCLIFPFVALWHFSRYTCVPSCSPLKCRQMHIQPWTLVGEPSRQCRSDSQRAVRARDTFLHAYCWPVSRLKGGSILRMMGQCTPRVLSGGYRAARTSFLEFFFIFYDQVELETDLTRVWLPFNPPHTKSMECIWNCFRSPILLTLRLFRKLMDDTSLRSSHWSRTIVSNLPFQVHLGVLFGEKLRSRLIWNFKDAVL